jgi:HAD superfamily hydrolase (TIGR01509 family)
VSDLSRFRFRAVVFDLDGTLVDNMPWHAQAFDAFVARYGLPPFTMEWRRRTDGKRNSEIFPMLFDRPLTRDEIRAFEDEKEGMYRAVSRGVLSPMAGAVRFIDLLDAWAIPVAVATSAPAANVVHTLSEIGLTHRVRAIARGDQVPKGKPAPDVFLHAASLLGVPPADCLAFEDAPLGVAAARAAGMRCVAITSTFTAESFEAATPPPDWTCRDYDEFVDGPAEWLNTPAYTEPSAG